MPRTLTKKTVALQNGKVDMVRDIVVLCHTHMVSLLMADLTQAPFWTTQVATSCHKVRARHRAAKGHVRAQFTVLLSPSSPRDWKDAVPQDSKTQPGRIPVDVAYGRYHEL